ncbi:MAG: redoxin domain-containing protein [Planctomycetaceae bacterium]
MQIISIIPNLGSAFNAAVIRTAAFVVLASCVSHADEPTTPAATVTEEASDILKRVCQHSFQPLSNGFTNDVELRTHGVADPTNDDWKVNTLAVRDLCRQDAKVIPILLDAMTDPNLHVRHVAALSLGILPSFPNATAENDRRVAVLESALLNDQEQVVRSEAANALGRILASSAVPGLKKAAAMDSSRDVQHQCEIAIERIGKMQRDESLLNAYRGLEESTFNSVATGQPAPDFSLADTDRKIWTLSELRGRKTVVLIWIFADWCPVCHGEFRELIQMKQQYIDSDVAVVTIECHEQFRNRLMTGDQLLTLHGENKKTPQAGYPGSLWWSHLSDPAGAVGAMYGVSPLAFAVHSEYINRPSTVIIDKDGIVRFAYYGTFWGDRPSIHKTLEMIQSNDYQFVHPKRLVKR